jgi:hypothetical protein
LRLPDISYGTEESPNGEYVRYADYAALQAETVKRLEETIPPVEAYIIKLEAENERLRKAGDALLTCLDYPKAVWPDSVNPRIEAWRAAKETRP